MSDAFGTRGGRAWGLLVLGVALATAGCARRGLAPGGEEPTTAPVEVVLGAAQVAAGYVGSEQCGTCHRAQFLRFSNSEKGRLLLEHPRNDIERLGCEGCHGPGEQHAAVEGRENVPGFLTFAEDDPTPVADRNAACLNCHTGTKRMDWAGSQHETRELACTNCHQIMTQVSERNQLKRANTVETCGQCHKRQMRSQQMSVSRMPVLEQKMQCTSCHNPHGSANERLLLEPSVNETCYTCHAEKRGPFLWEHAPVTESCANCHEPHGSRHEKLLSVPKPRLCQQCHLESSHPTSPQTASSRFVVGRQCVNCHSTIHGSNHPAGNRFQR